MATNLIIGPVLATAIAWYDGDTVKVEAYPWPDVTIKTSVRVDGVDTPELRGKCQSEKDAARTARSFVRQFTDLELRNIHHGKYAGRVVAEVWVDGRNIAELIVAEGLGREYHGGRREGWC